MDYNMYNNKCLKPEGTLTDTTLNQPSRDQQQQSQQQQQQPNFPEWINEFSIKCLKICGTKCAEKLDETMEHYIKEIKKELFFCDSSPNRASLIANRMSKTLVFFYLYYTDIKEFFVISQWSENISQLLLYYCRLELKASHRVHRGKDSDTLVCSRIMNALWIYLDNNYEAMIHIILQMPQIGRRHKDILDPVFRKLLMSKRQKPMTELEYVRNLLAFKLWKRLYGKEDKKAISHLALTELKPPRSFMANYKKYKSLPACPHNVDVHTHFVTGLIDLESAIKEYLEVYHKTKRTDYHPTEKKSFISDFCSSFEGIENTPDDIGDSYMLDKIKNENDVQEIEDDDCIIVEDPVDPLPPVLLRIVPPDPTEVIDLTADEPDNQLNLSDDVVPLWCKELIKQSEEMKITPPPSPVTENQAENTIEAKLETLSQRKDLLTPIENVDIVEKEPITPMTDVTPRTDIASPKLDILPPTKDITPPSPPATIEENMSSEDNSTGLTEITSTSHPVQDVTQDIVDSSDFTSLEPSVESAKEVYKDNFEHVDSTSNINEEDCDIDIEEPTVKAFVVERTVSDGIVCSEVISEVSTENGPVEDNICEQTVSAVSNIEFEQFASQNVSNVIENHLVISHVTGKSDISRFISDSDELTDDILDEDSDPIDSISDNNNSDTPVLLDKESESSLHSQHEIDDFTSPAIEPMSGKDFANYLAGLNSDMYEEFNKNPDPIVGDIQTTKKRKIEENSVRTYTKRTVRFDTLLTPEPIIPESQIPPPEPKERRVPLNGERVRFGDIWESIYTGTFNLTQKECKLLMPNVIVKKDNPKYWIQDYERFTADDNSNDMLDELKNPFNVHHLYGTAMAAKKILERQDYLKPKKGGEENPRARVIKRPIPGSLHSSISSESKLPDVLMPTKRRGPRKQATTEVVKKRKVGRRKATRFPAESSPAPNPVEQNPETTPWRFSVS